MTREEIIRNLEYTMEKHRNDTVNTFETNISAMCKDILDYLEQEPCDDCISRQSIKRKLQEHHDFFINAYGNFNNMPQDNKSRVDEINNCIAIVVNEPPIIPKEKTGKWIYKGVHRVVDGLKLAECSTCRKRTFSDGKFCPNCGARMVSE